MRSGTPNYEHSKPDIYSDYLDHPPSLSPSLPPSGDLLDLDKDPFHKSAANASGGWLGTKRTSSAQSGGGSRPSSAAGGNNASNNDEDKGDGSFVSNQQIVGKLLTKSYFAPVMNDLDSWGKPFVTQLKEWVERLTDEIVKKVLVAHSTAKK